MKGLLKRTSRLTSGQIAKGAALDAETLQSGAHLRAQKRLQLADMVIIGHGPDQLGVAAAGGVEVDFAGALQRACTFQQRQHDLLGHDAGLAEAEGVIVAADAGLGQPRPQQRGPRRQRKSAETAGTLGLGGQTNRPHPVIAPDFQDQPEHGRMQMEMAVGIDVIERKAGLLEGLELGAQFGLDLSAGAGQEEAAHSGLEEIGVKTAIGPDQRRQFARRQQRPAVDQHQMQPDPQFRQPPGALDGVGGGLGPHHQAGGGEDAIAGGPFHRLVNGEAEAEVIGGHDQSFHGVRNNLLLFFRLDRVYAPASRLTSPGVRPVPITRLVSFFTSLAVAFALLTAPQPAAAENGQASAIVSAFYATLLTTMKDGPKLKFAGRFERLTPAMAAAFDLPGMARIAAGAHWPNIKPEEQQKLVESFSRFSVASYAANFDGWSGESFEVLKESPAPGSGNAIIVETKLVPKGDDPVQLNYLLRPTASGLRIIDVFVNGTISQLAARRSEFASVLARDGAKGLNEMLEKRLKDLASK